MSKMKKKKTFKQYNIEEENPSQLGVIWRTNNMWYEIGIKKKIAKGWPRKKLKVQ